MSIFAPASRSSLLANGSLRRTCVALLLALPLSASFAQVSARTAASAGASVPQGSTRLPVQLASGISSQSAKVGQQLLARVTQPASLANGTSLPAGSQLLGRVTEVKSLGGHSGVSRLGMVFDQLKTPDGQVKKIRSTVENLAPSASADGSGDMATNQQASASGGLLGGVTDTVGGVVNTATGALGSVTGLPGVLLSHSGGGSGLLSAQGSNVSLASGTQITLAVKAAN